MCYTLKTSMYYSIALSYNSGRNSTSFLTTRTNFILETVDTISYHITCLDCIRTSQRSIYQLYIVILYISSILFTLTFSLRSYQVENTVSRPICEVKQPWACLVLGWVTTGETHRVVSIFFFHFDSITWSSSLDILLVTQPILVYFLSGG